MVEMVKISCPSCGNKLTTKDSASHFVCPSCNNEYLIEQTGDTLSLVPLLEKMSKSGTFIVGNGASIVHAENVYMGQSQLSEAKTESAAKKEKSDCPICGKSVFKDGTFRCKKCERSFICLSHQDEKTYLCSECIQQTKRETNSFLSLFQVRHIIFLDWLIPIIPFIFTAVLFNFSSPQSVGLNLFLFIWSLPLVYLIARIISISLLSSFPNKSKLAFILIAGLSVYAFVFYMGFRQN